MAVVVPLVVALAVAAAAVAGIRRSQARATAALRSKRD